ncbi:hypothetical protein GCM10027074_41130 [Streptomyces deserti]
MAQPSELDRARQDCGQGESLLTAGDLEEAARVFRAVLARVGPFAGGGAAEGAVADPVGGGMEQAVAVGGEADGAGTVAAGGDEDTDGLVAVTVGGDTADSTPAEGSASGGDDTPTVDDGTPMTGGASRAERAPAENTGSRTDRTPTESDASATDRTPTENTASRTTGTPTDGAVPGVGSTPTRLAVRAHVGLGRVRLAGGETVGAEEEFGRAMALDPVDPGPLYWLGCAAAHQGAYATAEQRFTEVLSRCAGHGRSLVQRAYVRVRLGRTAGAVADLRAAQRVGALDAEARWVLAALSGTAARGVAGMLVEAARSAMARAQAAGPQGRSRAGDDWSRAAALLDSARQLAPDERSLTLPHAVALCLSGRRPDALALLADASSAAPADRSVAHTLAVMAWHGLPPSGSADAARAWVRCVSLWAGLLHDAAFWERRRTEAAERYGMSIDDAALSALRTDLHDRLEAVMPENGPDGRPAPEAVLDRETEAARRLADAGGLPLTTGAAPVVCGPLRIAELGRERELSAFVATAGEAAPALRRAFSQLGFVEALLGQNRPGEALAALSGLRCPSCRARGASGEDGTRRAKEHRAGERRTREHRTGEQSSGTPAAPVATAPEASAPVCDPHCPHFDTRNPAYAVHPGKHALLLRDGRALALEARLAQGRAALTPAGPDVPTAALSWRRALAHARALERAAEVEEAIVGTALGAAKALHRAGDLRAAGATLEAAYALVGEGRRNRLQGQLARVLTDRGIVEANRDPDRLESPAADLRRAVELNPHLHRPQVNLAVVLRFLGARMRWSGSLAGARNRLEEALDRLTDALALFPDDPELTELRDLVEHDLALVRSELEQGRIGGLPG